MGKITIHGKTASREYEEISVEFLSRDKDGSGEAILTVPTGKKARVKASFAGPGGARTIEPDEIFIREILEGRDEFPYLWAL